MNGEGRELVVHNHSLPLVKTAAALQFIQSGDWELPNDRFISLGRQSVVSFVSRLVSGVCRNWTTDYYTMLTREHY